MDVRERRAVELEPRPGAISGSPDPAQVLGAGAGGRGPVDPVGARDSSVGPQATPPTDGTLRRARAPHLEVSPGALDWQPQACPRCARWSRFPPGSPSVPSGASLLAWTLVAARATVTSRAL